MADKNYKTSKEIQIEEAKRVAELIKAKTKGPQFPSKSKVAKPEETKQETIAKTIKK